MKRRTVQTYKILAVALTTAGCSSASSVEITATPLVATAEPAAETGTPAPSLPAGAEHRESSDPALFALGEELKAMKRGDVLANPARFQPLCDKDGYPLVGNLVGKGDKPKYTPSEFCRDVRAQAKR